MVMNSGVKKADETCSVLTSICSDVLRVACYNCVVQVVQLCTANSRRKMTSKEEIRKF